MAKISERLSAATKYLRKELMCEKVQGSLTSPSKNTAAYKALNEAKRAGVPLPILSGIDVAVRRYGNLRRKLNR